MSLLVTRYLKRSELVQELYQEVSEDWQHDHKQALIACDVEELVGECVDLAQLCTHVWQSLRNYLPQIRNTQQVGRTFQKAVAQSIAVLKLVIQLCETAKQEGYEVSGALDLHEGHAELLRIAASLEANWPFISMSMIDEARAEYLAGNYRTAEELLHDAQNGGFDVN